MKVWIYPPYPEMLPEEIKRRFPSLEIVIGKEEVKNADIVIGNPSTEILRRNSSLKLIQLRSAGTADFPALVKEKRVRQILLDISAGMLHNI